MREFDEKYTYHLILISKNGYKLFRSDSDKIKMLRIINAQIIDSGSAIYAFTIMDTHIHLEINSKHIKELALNIIKAYTGYYSQKYSYQGALFVYPPTIKDKPVLQWQVDTLIYIINNPIEANMAKTYSGYKYSSYRFYTKGGSPLKNFIQIDTSLFSNNFKSIFEFRIAAHAKLQYELEVKRFKIGWDHHKGGGQ
jgi:putative transposase